MKRYLSLLAVIFLSCHFAGGAGGQSAAGAAKRGGETGEAMVRGDSLSPLINAGDSVKIDYGYYAAHEIKKGDIVVCRFSFRQTPVIKIVRAVPGDRFGFRELGDGSTRLLVNGAELKNSAGRPYKFSGKRKQMLSLYEKDYKGVIPANSYLLLGNLVEGSLDSGRIGLVGREVIIGKAEKQ